MARNVVAEIRRATRRKFRADDRKDRECTDPPVYRTALVSTASLTIFVCGLHVLNSQRLSEVGKEKFWAFFQHCGHAAKPLV